MARLLIVEDKKDIRDSLTLMLSRGGFNDIITASDGIEALEAYHRDRPDLIISDINMPNCDGLEFVRKLRETPSSEFIPVIFLSARTSTKHQTEGFEVGVDNYVCKPIERSQRPIFLAMIRSLLQKSSKQRDSLSETSKDQLTGLSRRGDFFSSLKNQIAANERGAETTISIALLDLDNFKNVNDTHGHLTGDKVLEKFSEVLSTLRQSDTAFRYGGEEFAIVFLNTDADGVVRTLERIREVNKTTTYEKNLLITFSAGVFPIPTNANTLSVERYVEMVDQALYEAKNTGRDRIVIFHSKMLEEVG